MIRFLIAFFCITAGEYAIATDQEWETIMVEGKRNWLVGNPLLGYWSKESKPKFDFTSTSNWGGYKCEWEIRDSALYLINFSAKMNGKPVTHSDIFPSGEWPLRAEWYTGVATVVEEPFRLSQSEPYYAIAGLYLIEQGRIRLHRHFERKRFGTHLGPLQITIKREAELLRIYDPHLIDAERIPVISPGDILVGVVNHDGFSINFTDESAELATAVLATDEGNVISLMLKTPSRNDEIRSVKIKRDRRYR